MTSPAPLSALIARLKIEACDSDLKPCRENWPTDPASWCAGCLMLAAAEALAGEAAPVIDPSNHHNALACPYCNPKGLKLEGEAVPEKPTEQDYRTYARRQLEIAIEKDADAPASAQMHEEQAAYALLIGRIPTGGEVLEYLQSLGLGTCNCRHENQGYKFYPHNPWCPQQPRAKGEAARPDLRAVLVAVKDECLKVECHQKYRFEAVRDIHRIVDAALTASADRPAGEGGATP